MRRTLLAVAAAALLGGAVLLAVASLGSAPRVAGASGAQAASGTGDGPVESGPFALAAERAEQDGRASSHRGYVRGGWRDDDAGDDRRRLAGHLFELSVRGLADRLDVSESDMRAAIVAARSAALTGGDRRDRSTWDERRRVGVRTLARVLDLPTAQVASATRNQLEHTLGLAMVFDLLTAKGRELALACWDTPQRCQVTALRLEILVDGDGAR